jgi:hypothetical protein
LDAVPAEDASEVGEFVSEGVQFPVVPDADQRHVEQGCIVVRHAQQLVPERVLAAPGVEGLHR